MRLVPSLLFIALLLPACTSDPPLDVANVELQKFQGTWYEIARLPRATEANCTGTIAFYRLKSKTELDVVNQCHDGTLDGPLRRVAARAVVSDPDVPAKLSLDFGGFYGDYWIVEVDPEYRTAAVGHPSRDYLWILRRTPTMPDEELAAVSERMRAKGFDASRLERTPQDENADVAADSAKAEALPSASDHGCSIGRAPGRSANRAGRAGAPQASMIAAALALLLSRRRRTRASTN